VAGETLARAVEVTDAPRGDRNETFEFDGETVTFAVKR
jgi:hypothetical protein